jgi:hypothetical protein
MGRLIMIRTTKRIGMAAATAIMLLYGTVNAGAAGTLDIELNKIEDAGGQCSASFVMQNHMGATLDQLRIDLYVFDKGGVIMRRVYLDTGPMRDGKTTVASFALVDQPCDKIGRLLVNDIPTCKAPDGNALDCLAGLTLTSKAAVELAK